VNPGDIGEVIGASLANSLRHTMRRLTDRSDVYNRWKSCLWRSLGALGILCLRPNKAPARTREPATERPRQARATFSQRTKFATPLLEETYA